MGHVNLRKAKTRFLTTLGLGAPALILWASQETSMVLCKRSGSLRSFVRTSRSQVCHSFSSLHKLHQQASIFISGWRRVKLPKAEGSGDSITSIQRRKTEVRRRFITWPKHTAGIWDILNQRADICSYMNSHTGFSIWYLLFPVLAPPASRIF